MRSKQFISARTKPAEAKLQFKDSTLKCIQKQYNNEFLLRISW